MTDVLMPRLSDTMTEGIVTQWLKQQGEQVSAGDVLAEIETDKATMELEAYESGVLTRIIAPAGSTVPIGKPIAVIGNDTAEADKPIPEHITPTVRASTAVEARRAVPDVGDARHSGLLRTSPLARRLARQHGLDLTGISGSGPGGRIVRADVEAAIAEVPQRPGGALPSPLHAAPPPVEVGDADTRIPLTTIRRITAQRLTESVTAPHFYLTSVIDAQPLLALRADLNDSLTTAELKITVTDLLIRACAVALRDHPQANASWAGDHLIRHGRIHVGFAVALDDGLIVPVIRDADRKSISVTAAKAHELADRARAGKLLPDEFTGGTFTISNLGMFGIDHFTAVINPPEAAILAVGAAQQEAVVRDGQLSVGTTIKLTLSIDHRVLDGATAAAFLRDLRELLEHPLRIVI